MSLLAKDRQT